MSSLDCAAARDLIPDLAAGRTLVGDTAAVEEHVADCEECFGELKLARMLARSRPTIPTDLTERVLAKHRSRRRALHRPWWGISAAAVAALALGIGITSESAPEGGDDVGAEVALEQEEGELWLSDDGILAGAPVLEALSDEALAQLLDELTPAAEGGQA